MNDQLKQQISLAKANLVQSPKTPLNMLIGFDGFVDEIIQVVDTRQDFNSYTRVKTISDFSARIERAAGKSANIEFVTVKTKLGGNGPIFANALLNAGAKVTYIGSIGDTTAHPVFSSITDRACVFPVCPPGTTDALEFTDGKLMLGKHSTLKGVTWDNILKTVGGVDRFTQMLNEANLFGMENWTMIPYMSDIWQSIINEVLPFIPDNVPEHKKPIAFFDLADPEKRTNADILQAMELIGRFNGKFRTVLGLNEKEVYEIAEVFDIKTEKTLEAIVTSVYEKLDIYCLTVHPTKEAAACSKGGYYSVAGPYCENPVLTTGAGDNYNAGFCLGLSLGLDITDSLVLGVATSGFYVRNAASPTHGELIDFLQIWSEGGLS